MEIKRKNKMLISFLLSFLMVFSSASAILAFSLEEKENAADSTDNIQIEEVQSTTPSAITIDSNEENIVEGNEGIDNKEEISINVNLAVVGMYNEILISPQEITLTKTGDKFTALDALMESGLEIEKNDESGFITSIAGQENGVEDGYYSSISGWMYKVNFMMPNVVPGEKEIKEGDYVFFYYAKSHNDLLPSWDENSNDFVDVNVRVEGDNESILENKTVNVLKGKSLLAAVKEALEEENIDNDISSMINGIKNITTGSEEAGYKFWLCALNNDLSNVLEPNNYNIDAGDNITVYLSDTVSPVYAKLEVDKKEIEQGETFTVTVSKDDGTQNYIAAEGVKVDFNNAEYVTDTEGKVTITAENEGVYEVCAYSEEIVKTNKVSIKVKKAEGKNIEEKDYAVLVKESVDKASDWLINNFNSRNHWSNTAIVRAGKEVPVSYLEQLNKKEKILENVQGQYGKYILGILSAGGEPQNIAGHNLYNELCTEVDFSNINIYGAPWDLIALDASAYKLPENCNFSREELINKLLSKEVKDGGFSSYEDSIDIDSTGVIAVALYPYYDENTQVKEALDLAVQRLSKVQNSDGGFGTDAEEESNINSTAQALMTITLIGKDGTDEKFTKTEGNIIDYILSLQNEDGSFNWKKNDGGSVDLATIQAVYGLEQYLYCLDDKGSIWDFVNNPVSDETPGKDTKSPSIVVNGLTDNKTVYTEQLTFTITVNDNVDKMVLPTVKLNGQTVEAKEDGSYNVVLLQNENKIVIEAVDSSQNKASLVFTITYNKEQIFEISRNDENIFKNDEDAELKISVTNISQDEREAVFVVQLYDLDNNKSISYSCVNKTVKSQETEILKGGFTVPEKGNYIVKGTVWDNMDSKKVLVDDIEVKVSN